MCILKIKVFRLHKNHGVLAWLLLSSEHAASRMYLFKNFVFYSKIQGFLARGWGGSQGGGGTFQWKNCEIFHVCFFKKSLVIKKFRDFWLGGGGSQGGGGRFQWKMANFFQVFFFEKNGCFFI